MKTFQSKKCIRFRDGLEFTIHDDEERAFFIQSEEPFSSNSGSYEINMELASGYDVMISHERLGQFH